MTRPIFILSVIICIFSALDEVSSFSLNKLNNIATHQNQNKLQPVSNTNIRIPQPQQPISNKEELSGIISQNDDKKKTLQQSLIAGCTAFATTCTPLSAFAAEELEIESLPPVYVPILFAIGVLGGVGVLTASLGNVMDEGMSIVLIISLCLKFRERYFALLLFHPNFYSKQTTEASLGLQSGARAKKERERSRSSYFKK